MISYNVMKHFYCQRTEALMDNAAGTVDSDYVEDLQLIRSIREDDSFWDCIFEAKLDFLNNDADPFQASCCLLYTSRCV